MSAGDQHAVIKIFNEWFALVCTGKPLNPAASLVNPTQHDCAATAIDLAFASPTLYPTVEWFPEDDTLGSDHLPISCHTSQPEAPQPPLLAPPPTPLPPAFDLAKADWPLFASLLAQNIDTLPDDSTDQYADNITTHILTAATASIPAKLRAHPNNPWWDEECEAAKKAKQKAYALWKKRCTPDTHAHMKTTKVAMNRAVAKAKRHFFDAAITLETTSHRDLAQAWKRVKQLKKEWDLPPPPLKQGGETHHTDIDKAEAFASEFASVSQTQCLPHDEIARRAKEESTEAMSPPPPDNTNSINAPLTLNELSSAISSISSAKVSVGPDGISYEMIRRFPPAFLSAVLTFFQHCFTTGTLPAKWNHSHVVPIHKQGKPRNDASSYRPISLTSHLSKIYERIIKSRLAHYLERNSTLPDCQAGFRKARSVQDHLITLTSHVKTALRKRKCVTAVFFDTD
nr:hypothetical protein BaRGS_003664 [Batillaria attramentaria]